jgi:hypothetical protein
LASGFDEISDFFWKILTFDENFDFLTTFWT